VQRSTSSHAASLSALREEEQNTQQRLWAKSTRSSRDNAKRKVADFNRRYFPSYSVNGIALPTFFDAVDASGKSVTACEAARLFFVENKHLKQSTLLTLRSNINATYAQLRAGPPPWDEAFMHSEQPYTASFINRIIKTAAPPTPHSPLPHDVFCRLVMFLMRVPSQPQPGTTLKPPQRVPIASFALAACACILRGSGGRPQEAILLRKSYVTPNTLPSGQRDGFNIFFPQVNENGVEIKLKGKGDVLSRYKVVPERLDDGFPIATIIGTFLNIAPSTGPLFQTTRGPRWSGIGWTTQLINDRMQAALMNPKMGLGWPLEVVKAYTSHSFRTTAATSMSEGGVGLEVVSKALNHSGVNVTATRYIHKSKEALRKGLSVTGACSSRS
jgi:integrase